MKPPELPIVLASGSPRRKELLSQLGLQFEIDTSNADESFIGNPIDTVYNLSWMKARTVALRHKNSIIVGADTVVSVEDEVLGKPTDYADAERMLKLLSGRWHSVYTGVCVINTQTGKACRQTEETRVHFLPICESDISSYLSTKEPYDKAGAYAIQGAAGAFIDKIEGSYSNVVGLPMHVVVKMIREVE